MLQRYDVQVTLVYPGPVTVHFRVEPCRHGSCGFDEEELAITIRNPCPKTRVGDREFAKDIDNEPLVLYRVAIVDATLKKDEAYAVQVSSQADFSEGSIYLGHMSPAD